MENVILAAKEPYSCKLGEQQFNCAAALLIFLSTPAGAKVVSANLFRFSMHLFDWRSCTEELHQRYRVVLGIQGGVFVLNGIMIDYSGDGPLPTLTSDISHLIELIPVQNHHWALGAEKSAVGSDGK